MKINQSFLYGMGSGLIIASILFGASDLLEASSQPQGSLLLPPAASQPTGSQSTTSQPTPAQTNPQQTAEQQVNQQQQPTAPSGQQPAAAKVKVEIKEGMDGVQIAQLLVQNGVVSNAEAFLNTAGDRVKSIRIGVYDLPLGGDPEQIITLITKK